MEPGAAAGRDFAALLGPVGRHSIAILAPSVFAQFRSLLRSSSYGAHVTKQDMKNTIHSVAQSELLAGLSRIAITLGTPIMIAVLGWFAAGFIALKEVVAVQVAVQTRLVAEVAVLQEYRKDAYARGVARDATDAALKEGLSELRRMVERFESRNTVR